MGNAWRLAVGTLTAVPVPPPTTVDRRVAGRAMLLAPIAAVPLAALIVGVGLAGGGLGWPPLLTALIAIGAVIGLNRAFHLDGLSDTVDGLAASFDRERSLEVMKSGTSGPAGVAAMLVVVGIQVVALSALVDPAHPDWHRRVLLGAAAVLVSRGALALCCTRGLVSARPDGLGKLFTETIAVPTLIAVWLLLAGLLVIVGVWAGLAWWHPVLAVVLTLCVLGAVLAKVWTRLGGVTGDVFGACVEVALASVLVGLL